MKQLLDAKTAQGRFARCGLLLLTAYIALIVADLVSALLVSALPLLLARIIGYGATGLALGYLFCFLVPDRAKLLVYLLLHLQSGLKLLVKQTHSKAFASRRRARAMITTCTL